MEIREVDEDFAVAGQISPESMARLAERGFVAVICNRPDAEEPGQPGIDAMRAAAQDAGLAFHHIPVSGGTFPEPAIAAFRAVRLGTDGPMLAYCRTGTRSITLETLANPHNRPLSRRLQDAQVAGYDLSAMADRFGDRSVSSRSPGHGQSNKS